MSDSDKQVEVYTSRVKGGLVDELDLYIENSDESKSKTLKELLEAGLELERADRTLREYQTEIDRLEDRIADLDEQAAEAKEAREQAEDRAENLRLSADLVLLGVSLFALLLVFENAFRSLLSGVPIVSISLFGWAAIFMALIGMSIRIAPVFRKIIQRG